MRPRWRRHELLGLRVTAMLCVASVAAGCGNGAGVQAPTTTSTAAATTTSTRTGTTASRTAARAALTSFSTCAEWAAASFTLQQRYAAKIRPGLAVPRRYSGTTAVAYVHGMIARDCARASRNPGDKDRPLETVTGLVVENPGGPCIGCAFTHTSSTASIG